MGQIFHQFLFLLALVGSLVFFLLAAAVLFFFAISIIESSGCDRDARLALMTGTPPPYAAAAAAPIVQSQTYTASFVAEVMGGVLGVEAPLVGFQLKAVPMCCGKEKYG